MLTRIKQLLGISPSIAEQFSDDVRWTFGRANRIAQESGAEYITSAHVLAAMTEHPGGGVYLGVTDTSALRADALGSSASAARDDLKRVLELAIGAAKRNGEGLVGMDDIVEAMLQSTKLLANDAMIKHGVRARTRRPTAG